MRQDYEVVVGAVEVAFDGFPLGLVARVEHLHADRQVAELQHGLYDRVAVVLEVVEGRADENLVFLGHAVSGSSAA